MPSVELSNLGGISPARVLSETGRAQTAARAPASVAARAAPAGGISVEVTAAASSAGDAATPPVDAERVKQIRAALQEGSYPLSPTKIADAIIAAQVSLSLPEKG